MSLLQRIAVSRGNESRKRAATKVLASMEHAIVVDWNKTLRNEIRQKTRSHLARRSPVRVQRGR